LTDIPAGRYTGSRSSSENLFLRFGAGRPVWLSLAQWNIDAFAGPAGVGVRRAVGSPPPLPSRRLCPWLRQGAATPGARHASWARQPACTSLSAQRRRLGAMTGGALAAMAGIRAPMLLGAVPIAVVTVLLRWRHRKPADSAATEGGVGAFTEPDTNPGIVAIDSGHGSCPQASGSSQDRQDGSRQTRAVSLRNRQIAAPMKIASHATALTAQVQFTPAPSSGACTSWLSPYSGVHLAIACTAPGSWLIGMNRPPAKASRVRIRLSNCVTFSAGSREPTNRPNAANSSEPTQTHTALTIHI